MEQNKKAWIIAVDMGYGHQRTAYPLRGLSPDGSVINANHYPGIPDKDKTIWNTSREFYELISNLKRIPIIGNMIFGFFNNFQKILHYYPIRDLSKSNVSLKEIFALIKRGWGENLIKTLKGNPLPIVSTFFTPAFMAEVLKYPNQVYCVICDADIARSWVALDPEKSNIKYFAPCNWVVDRLKRYGVKAENIYLTGYPLPKENIGTEQMEVLKSDVANRILNLDPQGEYRRMYHAVIEDFIGDLPKKSDHPLTVMFSVGGAGAQKEMCCKILKSLRKKITAGEIKMILSAGIKEEVRSFLIDNVKEAKLELELGTNIEILFEKNINDYFIRFNKTLRKTDILWTKPSELSFYSALGVPIIIAPSIGSQEDFNKKWLLHIGSAFPQENPNYTDQWLFDMIESGRLAEAAMQGFVEIEKLGAYNIEKIISK